MPAIPVYICLFVRRLDVRGEVHSSLPYRIGYRALERAAGHDAELISRFPRSRLSDRPAPPAFELTAVAPRRRAQMALDLGALA